jgi:hypothetical protein
MERIAPPCVLWAVHMLATARPLKQASHTHVHTHTHTHTHTQLEQATSARPPWAPTGHSVAYALLALDRLLGADRVACRVIAPRLCAAALGVMKKWPDASEVQVRAVGGWGGGSRLCVRVQGGRPVRPPCRWPVRYVWPAMSALKVGTLVCRASS